MNYFTSNYMLLVFRLSGHRHKPKFFYKFEVMQERLLFISRKRYSSIPRITIARSDVHVMSTWAILMVSPRSGTDEVPIPVSASAFSSRRRGTPRIYVYIRRRSLRTCTQELVRVLQRYVIYVIRWNDNGYLHGKHREHIAMETQHPARRKIFRKNLEEIIIISMKKDIVISYLCHERGGTISKCNKNSTVHGENYLLKFTLKI